MPVVRGTIGDSPQGAGSPYARSGQVHQLYQASYLPQSFLLNRQGVIVKRISGEYDWNSPANRALIKRLLAEPAR